MKSEIKAKDRPEFAMLSPKTACPNNHPSLAEPGSEAFAQSQ
jgi:hypothetical protein